MLSVIAACIMSCFGAGFTRHSGNTCIYVFSVYISMFSLYISMVCSLVSTRLIYA